MASPDVEFPWLSSVGESFSGSFNMRIQEGNTTANIHVEEGNTADILPVMEIPTSSVSGHCNIPNPPPLPSKCFRKTRYPKRPQHFSSVPKETKESWDKLFKESHGADVYIITEDRSCIPAHFSILSIASSVLRNILQQSKVKNGIRYIRIPGVPCEAVYTFIRFLYSSW